MMAKSAAAGAVVFVVVWLGLSLVEALIHRLRHNPDKDYRWGVWLFSILAGVYTFVTSLGRV